MRIPARLILALPFLMLASCGTPSTDTLAMYEQRFFDRKDEYDRLYEMFMEDDELTRLSFRIDRMVINDNRQEEEQWLDENGEEITLQDILSSIEVTEKRYRRYKQLMSELSVEEITQSKSGKIVYFVQEYSSLNGYFIDVVNAPGFPAFWNKVSSVHDVPTEEEGEFFVPLEGDWYLEYSYAEF